MTKLRHLLPSVLLAAAMAFSPFARAVEYTDLWSTPNEDGWGLTLTQSDSFMFATFYIYGANNQPTWFTGQMTQDSSGNFNGSLYASTGPWYGAVPYDRTLFGIAPVGSVSFQPVAADMGRLVYNVGATQVVKNITRHTLTAIPLSGQYFGGFSVQSANCSNAAGNATILGYATFNATQLASGQFTLDVTPTGGQTTCTLAGTLQQYGHLYRVPNATYTCGVAGSTGIVYELQATSLGLEGRWAQPVVVNGASCTEFGRFSALLR